MSGIFSMEGKSVVVTGGSGGLLTPTIAEMLKLGAKIAVADIAEPRYSEFPQEKLDNIFFKSCDAYDTTQIKEFVKYAYESMGEINVLINGATFGAGYGANATPDKMSDEEWEKGLAGSIGVVFKFTRECLPYLMKNGGAIVNFSSMYGHVAPDYKVYGSSGYNNPCNYGAGKAGVSQFTRYCAGNYGRYGIRVNDVTPGPFPKKEFVENHPEFGEELAKRTMLGRYGEHKEITGAVIYLACDASSYTTGTNIFVDGGWTAW